MKASIIIPVYNAEKTLDATMESVMHQTVNDFEVILIDDCSTDNSEYVCKKWKASDIRIKYFRNKENSGPSFTRNFGINIAQGEWILFVDSDDLITENFIEKLTSIPNVDLIWGNFEYYYPMNDKIIKTDHNYRGHLSYKEMLKCFASPKYGIGSLCNKAYRREFIIENNLRIDENRVYGEDWDFNLSMILKEPIIYCIPNSIYRYIKDGYTVSRKYYKQDLHSYIDSAIKIEKLIKEYNIDVPILSIRQTEIYNIISLMYKLAHSDLSTMEKDKEFKRIVENKNVKELIKNYGFFNPKLTLRQKITSTLLRFNLKNLAWLSLKI